MCQITFIRANERVLAQRSYSVSIVLRSADCIFLSYMFHVINQADGKTGRQKQNRSTRCLRFHKATVYWHHRAAFSHTVCCNNIVNILNQNHMLFNIRFFNPMCLRPNHTIFSDDQKIYINCIYFSKVSEVPSQGLLSGRNVQVAKLYAFYTWLHHAAHSPSHSRCYSIKMNENSVKLASIKAFTAPHNTHIIWSYCIFKFMYYRCNVTINWSL